MSASETELVKEITHVLHIGVRNEMVVLWFRYVGIYILIYLWVATYDGVLEGTFRTGSTTVTPKVVSSILSKFPDYSTIQHIGRPVTGT
jgi:hypothetical protein